MSSSVAAARTVAFGAALGILGVAAGAFGAHGLQGRVDSTALELWKTGAHYHLVHALALVATGAWLSCAAERGGKWGARAATAFLLGILIFSGTLYAMALGAPRWLGAVTPIGGLLLMLGWTLLLLGAKASVSRRTPG